MAIVIRGGHVITPTEERFTDVSIADGLISAVGPAAASSGTPEIDASGCFVTPGLFDLQVNGGPQCDFWADPDFSQVAEFADALARKGVTAILPTLITDDLDHMSKNIEFLREKVGVGQEQLQPATASKTAAGKTVAGAAVKQRRLPVRMPGIHLEGPCLSPERPGVHPKQHIAPLNLQVLRRIVVPPVKLITLAPELDPSGQTIDWLRENQVQIALGHSNASFEQAQQAFDRGVRLMTHTFNALPPLHHRAPGAVAAALIDDRVSCCVICDGKHLDPRAAQLVFKVKGNRRTILVTDIAHVGTTQGGLVGSSITLDEAVRNVVNWQILSFQDAILMASYNPAAAIGCDNAIGHLSAGKLADVVVWDKKTLEIKHVITGGELLF